jgi:hypothetical protein
MARKALRPQSVYQVVYVDNGVRRPSDLILTQEHADNYLPNFNRLSKCRGVVAELNKLTIAGLERAVDRRTREKIGGGA